MECVVAMEYLVVDTDRIWHGCRYLSQFLYRISTEIASVPYEEY